MTEPTTSPTDDGLEDAPPAQRRRRFLLGRLAEAVRRQDWFTVVLEVAIVVLGIVIGFQVNAWGAAQADERRGQAYAERLVADLRTQQENRRVQVGYFEAVAASAERTVTLLNAPSADPADLVVHAYRATEFVYIPQKRETWDAIVAAGHIGLLPADAADGVAYAFSQDLGIRANEALQESPYRRRVRSVLPHAVQSAIRERCSDVTTEIGQVLGFPTDCDLGLDSGVVASAAQALRDDPAVTEHLRYHFSDLATVLTGLRAEVQVIDAVILLLEGRDLEGVDRAVLQALGLEDSAPQGSGLEDDLDRP